MTRNSGDPVGRDPVGHCGLDMSLYQKKTLRCRTHGDVAHEWRRDDGWQCVLCDGQRWSG